MRLQIIAKSRAVASARLSQIQVYAVRNGVASSREGDTALFEFTQKGKGWFVLATKDEGNSFSFRVEGEETKPSRLSPAFFDDLEGFLKNNGFNPAPILKWVRGLPRPR